MPGKLPATGETGTLPCAEEQYGTRSLQLRRYTCDHTGVRRAKVAGGQWLWSDVQKFVKEAFFPQGYPDSVSDDYLAYQIWDTIQAFCSSITGTLATMAVLKGVGVGDSSATPLAATITWMLKDGTGMLGKILFAWLQGTDLDCNAKRWRLGADIMNDMGTFLDLLAPLFPQFFLLIVCGASVSKSIVGIAGGATRAALVQHQARRDNMADVAAKDSSQETLVNLIALLVNLVLTPAVAGHPQVIWFLFFLFTFFHLFANHRAVSVVKMETFNQNRLHVVMDDFLSSGKVPSPASANAREPILRRSTRPHSYSLGSPLSSVLTSVGDYEIAVHDYHQKGQKYVMRFQRSKGKVSIALHRDCGVADQLRAALVVEILNYVAKHNDFAPVSSGLDMPSVAAMTLNSPLQSSHSDLLRGLTAPRDDGALLLMFAQSVVEKHFTSIVSALQAMGWVTSHHLLGVEEWRYRWVPRSSERQLRN